MKYSKAFKIIRAVKELSQQEFAQNIGVDPSLISHIESGRREPTKKTVQLISKKFSIPLKLIELLSKERNEIVFDGVKINRLGIDLLKLLFRYDSEKKFFLAK